MKNKQIILLCLAFLLVSCGQVYKKIDLSSCTRLGAKKAPKELVIFSDFQCAYCKRAASEINRLHKKHPEKFKVYFKHYPLSYHAFATKAARAAEAAKKQKKFWKMHNLLFAYANEMNDELFEILANQLKLNIKQFKKDFSSNEIKNLILSNKLEGKRIKLKGTPYFIINEVPFMGSYKELETVLLQ